MTDTATSRDEVKFFCPDGTQIPAADLYLEERCDALALAHVGHIPNEVERDEARFIVEAYLSLAIALDIEKSKVEAAFLNPYASEAFLDQIQADFVDRCRLVGDEIQRVLAHWQPISGGH